MEDIQAVESQQLAIWPWEGLIFEVQPQRLQQLKLLNDVLGLTNAERYFIRGIALLSDGSNQNRCDQRHIEKYLSDNNKKSSISLIKKRAQELHKLGLLERSETPRPQNRPAVVYSLSDLNDVIDSPVEALKTRATSEEGGISFAGRQMLAIDDPIYVIEGKDNYAHSYTQKINHVILRRCSKNPEHLGKKVALHLPGYGESVQVIQRTASGIPPMDGSEDRLQQALLTMFKEHISKVQNTHPDLTKSDFKNEWIVDLRQVCKTINIKPSRANILNQAKKLYQLRYNTFEIFFDPAGRAAKQLNLLNSFGDDSLKDHYFSEEDNTLHRLDHEQADQYFLAKLEPLKDEVVWRASETQENLFDESSQPTATVQPKDGVVSDFNIEELLVDRLGRTYRFYRISFFDRLFDECLNDALGQINKNPPSLLNEERKIARLLAYFAQRICTRGRNAPFMIPWGELAQEIQPVEETQKNVFQSLERIFKTEYKGTAEQPEWSPGGNCVVPIHGFCFRTSIPSGKTRKRASWQLMVWRDSKNSYTGDNGPAAMAEVLNLMRGTVIEHE